MQQFCAFLIWAGLGFAFWLGVLTPEQITPGAARIEFQQAAGKGSIPTPGKPRRRLKTHPRAKFRARNDRFNRKRQETAVAPVLDSRRVSRLL